MPMDVDQKRQLQPSSARKELTGKIKRHSIDVRAQEFRKIDVYI